ncbi:MULTISPECIES: ribbon-helix-helix protein, CopG family [unclassified Candidatus Tisiphia]|uniref:ribbon-helix-helix protein, CopG family n=1 Tax=unclassified Candidatus Tisiphia TaxID=2996318 RepID=UPI00312CBECC
MRTIVDIPDKQIEILDQLSKRKKVSRAEIVRQALDNYIGSYNKSKENYRMAFGIWKGKNIDSLLYQQKLRDEWSK